VSDEEFSYADATRSGATALPSLLRAPRRKASRRWQAIVKRMLKNGSWEQAFAGEPFFNVTSCDDVIDTQPWSMATGDEGGSLPLYLLFNHLCDVAAKDKYAHLDAIRSAVMEGTKHFWLSLAVFAGPPKLYPTTRNESTDRADAVAIARNVMAWWGPICMVSDRFWCSVIRRPWPQWALPMFRLCRPAGFTTGNADEVMALGPLEGGEYLSRWLLTA
jgi:hypothetical protein